MQRLLAKFQEAGRQTAQLGKIPRAIFFIVMIIVFGAVLLWIADRLVLLSISRGYVEQIAIVFNLNRHLAEAISLVICIFLVAFVSLLFSLSRRKRLIGILGIVGLLIANSLALWQGTKHQFFEASGAATKCYVLTREGVRFGERAGVDLATGQQCRPVTPDLVYRLEQYAEGRRPERITSDDPVFFDLQTGKPIVWFARTRGGKIELFDLMGYHPETGEELQPINRNIVREWHAQQREIAERPPQRIVDADKFVFFDPKTGNARAWYWRSPEGAYEFYDNRGFQPRTGDPLKPVTNAVLAAWSKQAAKKCYIVTHETIEFGSNVGIDPKTGRECRPFTAALLKRLKEYKAGRRPKQITTASPTFFDLRTGEPNLWYSRDTQGQIKLFDLIGFDPDSGQELLPVTTKIVASWKKQVEAAKRGPPVQIDPEKYSFFDTISGEPRVWYWHGGAGEWEFYNNPGFRSTGETLKIISQDVIDAWRHELADAKKRAAEQAAQTERDRLAAEEAEKTKQAAEAEQQRKLQQAGENCDRAAANPTDSNRPNYIVGVEYNDLKANARSAADACALAVKAYPDQPRYRYNLARALEFINPEQAINIYADLVNQHYVAAYDNYGGLLWRERKDLPAAIKQYEIGVRLGDPGAMMSLAYLIKRHLYSVPDPIAARQALLTKAAQAGQKGAQEMLDQDQQEFQARALQQQNQQIQQQMMMNLFGAVARGMAR